MSSTPSTIIITVTNKANFPAKMALVVMKQLFSYGVRDISLKGDKVYIQLTYSPKAETLTRKFGNLPISYIRTKIESEEELRLFEKANKKFVFNTEAEEANIETRKMITDLPLPPPSLSPQPSTSQSYKDNNAEELFESQQFF